MLWSKPVYKSRYSVNAIHDVTLDSNANKSIDVKLESYDACIMPVIKWINRMWLEHLLDNTDGDDARSELSEKRVHFQESPAGSKSQKAGFDEIIFLDWDEACSWGLKRWKRYYGLTRS